MTGELHVAEDFSADAVDPEERQPLPARRELHEDLLRQAGRRSHGCGGDQDGPGKLQSCRWLPPCGLRRVHFAGLTLRVLRRRRFRLEMTPQDRRTPSTGTAPRAAGRRRIPDGAVQPTASPSASGRREEEIVGHRDLLHLSTSRQIAASFNSVGVDGTSDAAGAGRGARRYLPPDARPAPSDRPCRSASAATRPARRTRRAPRSRAASAARCVAHRGRVDGGAGDIRHQRLIARRDPRAATTTASSIDGCVPQRALDFAELDAKAANLHLMIDAPEELDRAVGQPPHAIAGAIHARAGGSPRTDR